MTDVYTVICREGEHEYSWRDVGSFFDKVMAEMLCQNAQRHHDELRAQLPKDIRLTGLNPFDPQYDSDNVALYYVQHQQVADSSPADPAAADQVTVLEKHPALTVNKAFLTSHDIEAGLGDRAGKVEEAGDCYDLYDKPVLMKISYRNVVFELELHNGLYWSHHDWDAHEMTCKPVLRSSLTSEQWEVLGKRRGSRISLPTKERSATSIQYEGFLAWSSPAFDYFQMEVEVIPSGEQGILEQFTRAFEAWLAKQGSSRAIQPAFDAELKRVGF